MNTAPGTLAEAIARPFWRMVRLPRRVLCEPRRPRYAVGLPVAPTAGSGQTRMACTAGCEQWSIEGCRFVCEVPVAKPYGIFPVPVSMVTMVGSSTGRGSG